MEAAVRLPMVNTISAPGSTFPSKGEENKNDFLSCTTKYDIAYSVPFRIRIRTGEKVYTDENLYDGDTSSLCADFLLSTIDSMPSMFYRYYIEMIGP